MVSPSYSASSSSSSTATNHFPCPQERNTFKPPPPPSPAPHFHSPLHSVRKPSTKIMKKPIAPMPPTPRRVYKVDSSNFKQLVQKLTAAPEFQSRRLQSMAPPPLNLSTTATFDRPSTTLELRPSPIAITPTSETYGRELTNEKREIEAWKQSDSLATTSPAGFNLSPMSHAWGSSEILDTEPWKQSESLATASPVGFSLSPMSHAWGFSEILDTQPWKESQSLAMASPMGSSLSPWSHMWSSFPLPSPGTVSSLERGM
ncbi:hypothetical protein RHMOL_Rhmol10G0120100 [Rhododendron molle]|uniref:Uncharacterized protein n=1 Tax=Rhododendron molle TaxID=49168 RepID=A0ACC0M2C2_RHOML|nr:hypothetical protein RHMOL_Rhmol10G0120100 [Rhododendron molle]